MLLQRLATGATGVNKRDTGYSALVRACAVYTQRAAAYEFRRGFCTFIRIVIITKFTIRPSLHLGGTNSSRQTTSKGLCSKCIIPDPPYLRSSPTSPSAQMVKKGKVMTKTVNIVLNQKECRKVMKVKH